VTAPSAFTTGTPLVLLRHSMLAMTATGSVRVAVTTRVDGELAGWRASELAAAWLPGLRSRPEMPFAR